MLELSHLRQFSEFSRNSRLHLTMASLHGDWRHVATGCTAVVRFKLATTTVKALHIAYWPPTAPHWPITILSAEQVSALTGVQLICLKNEMQRTAVFPIVGLPVCQLLSYVRIFHPNAAYPLACGWRPLWPVSCSCRSRALTHIIQAYSMLFSFYGA